MKNLLGREEGKSMSFFTNPFSANGICAIHFHYRRKNMFDEIVNYFYATVEFESGNTKGEHKIEAKTFPELYERVMKFCESLE